MKLFIAQFCLCLLDIYTLIMLTIIKLDLNDLKWNKYSNFPFKIQPLIVFPETRPTLFYNAIHPIANWNPLSFYTRSLKLSYYILFSYITVTLIYS